MIDLVYSPKLYWDSAHRGENYLSNNKHVYLHHNMSHRPLNTTRIDVDDKEQKIDRQDSNHCRRPTEDLEHPQRDE